MVTPFRTDQPSAAVNADSKSARRSKRLGETESAHARGYLLDLAVELALLPADRRSFRQALAQERCALEAALAGDTPTKVGLRSGWARRSPASRRIACGP